MISGTGLRRPAKPEMTSRPGQLKTRKSCREAFTLIELIFVMAFLTILTSIAVPLLAKFFRGCELNSEACQLLSLTHAGQSRAVSAGFPMLLWIDSAQRTYGLQEEGITLNGAAHDTDPKAEQFPFS